MADLRDAASTDDYWVFAPYNFDFRGANTYLQGFKLKHSGKDTTTQELAIMPGLDTPWPKGMCIWPEGTVRHMTDHVSLAHLLSTLLRAVCRPLLPGCEFWCGRV